MNFQDLRCVESVDFYLDVAFRKARKKADEERGKLYIKGLELTRKVEMMKINTARNFIVDTLEKVMRSFPHIEDFDIFYKELSDCSFDVDQYRLSMANVGWTLRKIDEVFRKSNSTIRTTGVFKSIIGARNDFYGRASSLMKRLHEDFYYLEIVRKIMRDFPSIKTKMFTAAIAGFPNVGKSTLLSKLTSADPEINSYPFTTKGIMIGYIGLLGQKRSIQLLDTPGTLDRFDKMNDIERKAYLAIKHCSQMIIYVFDLSEEYPLDKQMKLLEKIKKDNPDKEYIVYLSKADILDKKKIEEFQKKMECITDSKELYDILLKGFRSHSKALMKEEFKKTDDQK